MKVILASSSRWRRELFQIYFPDLFISEQDSFLSPDIDEKSIRHDDPEVMVAKIAEAKCQMGVLEKRPEALLDADLVVTCDQIVVCRGQVREKPADEAQARAFLQSYSRGDPAEILNGLHLRHVPSGRTLTAVERSRVAFRPLPDRDVDEYLKGDEVYAAAGAFTVGAVNGLTKRIAELSGSAQSVEGFPVHRLRDLMLELCPDLPCRLPVFGAVRCVIFDMDGLLLDTEAFYTVVQQKILDRHGVKFTYEVKSKMMGRKALDAVNVMVDHYGLRGKIVPEEFVKERETMLDELFPESELLPGVERLLKHLKKHSVPMAIATGSHQRHFQLKTQQHKELFESVFDFVITGDLVKASKPDPEIFLKAFEKIKPAGCDVTDALVFEDAPLGVKAGLSANMKTVMVSHVKPDESLKPDLYLTNLLYFLPEQFGLPAFPDYESPK